MRFTSLLLALLLCACEPEPSFVERATQARFSSSGNDFWKYPLPSELRRRDDGTYGYNGWPGPPGQLVDMWLHTVNDRVREGWGVNGGAFFVTTKPLKVESLPSTQQTLTKDGAVQFIDIDPKSPEYGRRFPVDVAFTATRITFSSENIVSVVPVQGFPRRENTLYAVVLLDSLADESGEPLGPSLEFFNALAQNSDADEAQAAQLKPLREFLDKDGVPWHRVAGATVFRTIDPNATLKKLAAWVDTQPRGALESPWTLANEYDDFVVYTARYLVPHVQTGPRPGRGRIVWNEDGSAPVQQGTQSVRLSLAMPKSAPPTEGVPLMLYLHGSGGEYREVIDRGPLPQTATRPEQGEAPLGSGPAGFLARRGIASMGFDFPLHGDRENPPDTTGLNLYSLFKDIDSTVDNMSVAAAEVVYLTHTLPDIELPAPSGGVTHVNMEKLTAMGHSMGSTIGVPVATVDQRIKAYVFSGAGGMLLEVGTETTYPVALGPTVALFIGFQEGEVLTRNHPLLHAFQTLWDLTDPVAKARHVAREPYEGHAPHPYFMPQGLLDGYFHPGAQTALAGALGATLIGEPVDDTFPRTLALDGRGTPASYPLAKNLNGVTAGTLQLEVPFELGHYIVFDMQSVQSQVACFLSGVGTEVGPTIVSPRGVDDGCD